MVQTQKTQNKEERKTISIDVGVKEQLDEIGRISQSYSELIQQLITYWKEGHRDKK